MEHNTTHEECCYKPNIGALRQWLNEDCIDDPKKMVNNEDIELMLGLINAKKFQAKRKERLETEDKLY